MTHTVILDSRYRREQAHRLIDAAPVGAVMTVAPPKRTNDQNNLMWTLLSFVASAKPEGRMWTPETWKCGFMHLRGHQVRFAEGLDGSGPFPLGFRSSRLTKAQMSDLIEAIHEYAARHGVQLGETA
jgi:hypothetical protein